MGKRGIQIHPLACLSLFQPLLQHLVKLIFRQPIPRRERGDPEGIGDAVRHNNLSIKGVNQHRHRNTQLIKNCLRFLLDLRLDPRRYIGCFTRYRKHRLSVYDYAILYSVLQCIFF